MSTEKMLEEFEAKWGYTNEEQGLKFLQGLNIYGCDLYENVAIADSKSSAWYYWQASRAAIEVELPKPYSEHRMVSKPERYSRSSTLSEVREALEALGLKVKP